MFKARAILLFLADLAATFETTVDCGDQSDYDCDDYSKFEGIRHATAVTGCSSAAVLRDQISSLLGRQEEKRRVTALVFEESKCQQSVFFLTVKTDLSVQTQKLLSLLELKLFNSQTVQVLLSAVVEFATISQLHFQGTNAGIIRVNPDVFDRSIPENISLFTLQSGASNQSHSSRLATLNHFVYLVISILDFEFFNELLFVLVLEAMHFEGESQPVDPLIIVTYCQSLRHRKFLLDVAHERKHS